MVRQDEEEVLVGQGQAQGRGHEDKSVLYPGCIVEGGREEEEGDCGADGVDDEGPAGKGVTEVHSLGSLRLACLGGREGGKEGGKVSTWRMGEG